MTRTLVFTAFFAVLSGCATPSSEDAASADGAALSQAQVITLPANVGGVATATVLVSGLDRLSTELPSAGQCGKANFSVQPGSSSNFAWVELKNPSDQAEAVSVTVAGASVTGLSLFAYRTPTPPATTADANECLTSAEWQSSHTPALAPQLTAEDGTAVVIAPRASAYVMLATGTQTGAFTMTAKVASQAAVADRPSLVVPASAGGTASATVLVSGAARLKAYLPSGGECGQASYSVQNWPVSNLAYVELQNTNDEAAVASVTVAGPSVNWWLSLFAYGSPTPPTTTADVNQCMTSAAGSFVQGAAVPPRLSTEDGTAVVIAPHASVYVMLASGNETGAFTMTVRR